MSSSRFRAAAALDALGEAQRRAVLDKYCRHGSNGRIQFCAVSQAERDRARREGRRIGDEGKPIFPDLPSAEAAARELEALGSRPMYAYACTRSKHGHHHIATNEDRLPGRGGAR